ncbi:hypothetical protein [Paenibacillus eucommiae]|uniref:VanZ family protein n=1 Tax=Paenibacillus eucommiae TaxID=1355755 RepID=A0ABS4IQI8_9BACL|nr:hypothetical protein [Paenibacillus eucommiae]MBP1989843.1 hypothetical protein [Paenibacillus eucommiae]
MKKNSKRYVYTLSIFWLFTVIYMISFFLHKQWFPFPKWIDAVYAPIYKGMFGGLS